MTGMPDRSQLMLVTKPLEAKPAGGRALLCKLNHDVLQSIYGERLHLFELPAEPVRGVWGTLNAFRGHVDGVSSASIKYALAVIHEKVITQVFVDGSNLGALVAAIKRQHPAVEVTTFFHNAEARFFWGAFRLHKTPHALAVMAANYLAELQAVRWSDKRICLNVRDSRLLKRLYGQVATHISPMALEDQRPVVVQGGASEAGEPFALFVGGNFYANRAGIAWYAKHVAPHVDIKVCVVGRGFDALRQELEIPGKLEVIGAVDDLFDLYTRARFVIAPIFDGSGMKTKVAEALMYGKRVVGTPEAFCGYEDISGQAGWVCHSAGEFIKAMSDAQDIAETADEQALRAIYLEKYSMAAAKERIHHILASA